MYIGEVREVAQSSSAAQPSDCSPPSSSPCVAPPACCSNHERSGRPSELSDTPFRRAEKRYKLYQLPRRLARRAPRETHADFSEVVDFVFPERNTPENRAAIHQVPLSPAAGDGGACGGGGAVACYTFARVPGLLVFPQALTPAEQASLCRDAILEYGDSARHPNILSTHARQPRETAGYQPPMRWATLGFSYEWTTKSYARDRYSRFPAALRARVQSLVERVAAVTQDGYCGGGAAYEPQTAIVNYYPVGSMMMCHQDVSEEALHRPLVSVSLGCSAVFLMGGATREEEPTAFLLRSGDVAAFTGTARTAFHATPRILNDCPRHLTVPGDEDDAAEGDAAGAGAPATTAGGQAPLTEEERAEYDSYAYYRGGRAPDGSFRRVPLEELAGDPAAQERYWRLCMRHMRVNINVRQVYNESCPYLFEE